jgi:hypothetical protein
MWLRPLGVCCVAGTGVDLVEDLAGHRFEYIKVAYTVARRTGRIDVL